MSAPALILFPKSFPRPDEVRALIEFGMADAPPGVEVHVKSRPLRKLWYAAGFGVPFSTRARAARAFPDREVSSLTDWGPYGASGFAYKDARSVDICKMAPGSEWLVTLTVPTPEAYSANTWPHVRVYHGDVEKASAAWPRIELACWQDDVVAVAAHEARHVVQFVEDLPCSEVEAETASLARLLVWQRASARRLAAQAMVGA